MKEHFTYFCLPDEINQEELAAHVNPSLHGKEQHFINLHKSFFTVSTDQEQILTIIHEMTHDMMGTVDEKIPIDAAEYEGEDAYGEDKCRMLAKSYPDLAITNADNYAYYIRAAYDAKVIADKKVIANKHKSNLDDDDTKQKKKMKSSSEP